MQAKILCIIIPWQSGPFDPHLLVHRPNQLALGHVEEAHLLEGFFEVVEGVLDLYKCSPLHDLDWHFVIQHRSHRRRVLGRLRFTLL